MAKISVYLEFSKDQPIDLMAWLQAVEKNALQDALKESNGIKVHAARMLGMLRTTFLAKLHKYDLIKPKDI